MRQKDFHGMRGRGFLLENGKDWSPWPGAPLVSEEQQVKLKNFEVFVL